MWDPKRSISRTWTALHGTAAFGHTEALPHVLPKQAKPRGVCLEPFATLHAALRDKPCVALPSDMKVLVRASGHYYYPDASVVCGTAEFADDERDAIVNPTVVVEVLSDSTERRDRGNKFHDYRSIPSCTDYLMCSSAEPFVEHYTREADGWRLREYGASEVVPLRGVEITLSVAEVYAKAFGDR
jgi:Uma2 family endonuclease